jgi:hypothetical protein
MVVHNFYVVCIPGTPTEADAPLLINPDAVLSFSIASQDLKAITWRDYQLINLCCGIKYPKLSHRDSLNGLRKFS